MNNKNKKIWLLLDSSKSGGIESHVFQLARGLNNLKEDINVIFLNNYGHHPLRDSLVNEEISTITLDGNFSSLKKLMQTERPDVVHTHGYKAGILGRISSLICKIPTVSTFHAGETSTGKLGLYQWLDEKTAKLSSQILAVSPQIASKLPDKTQVFDNFIDLSDIKISNGDQLAFVGRLSREKGADYYLQLAAQHPDLTFHVYGEGPLREELEASATQNVIFHGQQDNMSSVWSEIGLLIMPSRNEGLPMAALEAMGRGIPVLASDVGALKKLINSYQNGWLVPSGDINALSKNLELWLNLDEKQKETLQGLAKEKIKKQFSTEVAIPKLISCYQEAIQ